MRMPQNGNPGHLMAVSLAVVFLTLLATGTVWAGTIEINTLLSNPSFEGALVSGCPSGWACNGEAGSYTPNTGTYSNQYTAGSDGFPSGLIVPNGLQTGIIPFSYLA